MAAEGEQLDAIADAIAVANAPSYDGLHEVEGSVDEVNHLKAAWAEEAIILDLKSSFAQEALQRLLGNAGFFTERPDFTSSLPADEAEIRSQLVLSALMALRTRRPEDALVSLNHAAVLGGQLSYPERVMFVSCTLLVTVKAKSSLSMLSIGSVGNKTEDELALYEGYKRKLHLELQNLCLSQIAVIDKYLLPTSTGESVVSYQRLKGQLLDFLSEGYWSRMPVYRALSSYATAVEVAQKHLCASNLERINASLDLAWYIEHRMNDPLSAYDVARTALDDAYCQPSAQNSTEMITSKNSLLILSSLVRRLSSSICGKEDWVPFPLRSKNRIRSPSPEYRGFNSTGRHPSMLKLPSNYVHPEIDMDHEIYAYLVAEGEEDVNDAYQQLGAINGIF